MTKLLPAIVEEEDRRDRARAQLLDQQHDGLEQLLEVGTGREALEDLSLTDLHAFDALANFQQLDLVRDIATRADEAGRRAFLPDDDFADRIEDPNRSVGTRCSGFYSSMIMSLCGGDRAAGWRRHAPHRARAQARGSAIDRRRVGGGNR